MTSLEQIVKAYDIRGTVPDQLDPEIAHALGVAFAELTQAPCASSSARTCARRAWSSSPPSPRG